MLIRTLVSKPVLIFTVIVLISQAQSSPRPELALQLGHSYPVTEMAVSPDGQTLASVANSDDSDRPDFGEVKLWQAQTGVLKRTLSNRGSIGEIMFSADGKTLLATIKGNAIKEWDVESGTLLRLRHFKPFLWAKFSSDAKIFIIAIQEGKGETGSGGIQIYDLESGRLQHTFRLQNLQVFNFMLSPDNSLLAVDGYRERQVPDGTEVRDELQIWDARTGKILQTMPAGSTESAFAFSPDGKTFAYNERKQFESPGPFPKVPVVPVPRDDTGDLIVRLVDISQLRDSISTGNKVASLKTICTLPGNLMRHADVFSPDGTMLLSQDDSALKVWNIQTQKLIHKAGIQDEHYYTTAIYTPDNRLLFIGGQMERGWPDGGGIIQAQNLRDSRTEYVIAGRKLGITHLLFLPQTQTIASADKAGSIRLWDLKSVRLQRTLPAKGQEVTGLVATSDGKTLAGSYWNNSANKQFTQLWSLPQKRNAPQSSPSPLAVLSDVNPALFFLPKSDIIAGASNDGIQLWSVKHRKLVRTLETHNAQITAAAASSGGALIATAAEDGTVKIWDALTGKLKRNLPGRHSGIHALAFSPDSKKLAIAVGIMFVSPSRNVGYVKLWDVRTGELLHTFAHTERVNDIAFSPDGKNLASIAQDETGKLWDVQTGRLVCTLNSSTDGAQQLDISSNGRWLITGGQNGNIKIWSAHDGHLLLTLLVLDFKRNKQQYVTTTWLAFTPEGFYDASPGAEKFIRWRVGDELFPAANFAAQFHRPAELQKALNTTD